MLNAAELLNITELIELSTLSLCLYAFIFQGRTLGCPGTGRHLLRGPF